MADDGRVTLRFSPEEVRLIDEYRGARGWSRTQLFRRLLERGQVIPTRDVRPGRRPAADVEPRLKAGPVKR